MCSIVFMRVPIERIVTALEEAAERTICCWEKESDGKDGVDMPRTMLTVSSEE